MKNRVYLPSYQTNLARAWLSLRWPATLVDNRLQKCCATKGQWQTELHNGLCHYLISLCLPQLTSLESLKSTPPCSNFTNAAINGFFANRSRRFSWLFSKAFVRVSLVATLPCSPIEHLEFFRRYAVPWAPDFLHAPNDQGSPSGPPQDVGPSSSYLGAVSPVSPPPSPSPSSPGGASAVRTRSERLSTAPHHLRPPEAPSPGSGASRRWLPLPPEAAPRRRGSAREVPRLHVLPPPEAALLLTLPAAVLEPRPGVVIVGDSRALCTREPVSARLGVVACEVVYPSTVVDNHPVALCVPPCSFSCL